MVVELLCLLFRVPGVVSGLIFQGLQVPDLSFYKQNKAIFNHPDTRGQLANDFHLEMSFGKQMKELRS